MFVKRFFIAPTLSRIKCQPSPEGFAPCQSKGCSNIIVNKSDVLDRKPINYRRVDGFFFTNHRPAAITREIVKLWPFGETKQVSRLLCMQKKSFWIDANKPTKFVCVAVCCTKHSHSSLVFRVLFFRLHKASRSEEKKLCKWPACRWSFFSKKFTKIVLTKMLTLETSLGALIVKLIRMGSVEVDKRRDGLKWSAILINNRTLELERNTKLVYEKFRWGSKSCAHSRRHLLHQRRPFKFTRHRWIGQSILNVGHRQILAVDRLWTDQIRWSGFENGICIRIEFWMKNPEMNDVDKVHLAISFIVDDFMNLLLSFLLPSSHKLISVV